MNRPIKTIQVTSATISDVYESFRQKLEKYEANTSLVALLEKAWYEDGSVSGDLYAIRGIRESKDTKGQPILALIIEKVGDAL